ncbi:MAG: hypothetical protein QM767_01485 [Anaeromyxobacter sp.]
MRRAVLAALLLSLPGLVPAAEPAKIVVGPFRRDDGKVLGRQLQGALCATYRCQPRSAVVTDGKLDLAKARAGGVAGVVTGTVTTWDGKRRLWIALRTVSPEPQRDWSFDLQPDGALSEASVQQLQRELAAELAKPRPPPSRAPLTTPGPVAGAGAAAAGKGKTKAPAPQPSAPTAQAAPPPAPPAPKPAAPPPAPPKPAPRLPAPRPCSPSRLASPSSTAPSSTPAWSRPAPRRCGPSTPPASWRRASRWSSTRSPATPAAGSTAWAWSAEYEHSAGLETEDPRPAPSTPRPTAACARASSGAWLPSPASRWCWFRRSAG